MIVLHIIGMYLFGAIVAFIMCMVDSPDFEFRHAIATFVVGPAAVFCSYFGLT